MISYESLYKYNAPGSGIPGGIGDMHRFRRVEKEGFNSTDSIDTRFFKILFYFMNDASDPKDIDWFNGGSSGLLAPTWLNEVNDDFYKYNSAWSYLKSNYEEERADALIQFVTLLSQISSESPWYFQSVSGVDEALTREKWAVSEERKKISIKCLADPVDHRIESLLSLYRSIVWSHVRKCEVLPANLRKFDMGLFIFSGLLNGLDVQRDENNMQTNWATFGNFTTNYDRANYKYIEFHNCEISMDSIKSGFSEISNEMGFDQTFTVDIYFDDCYEHEFNPFVLREFGDFFVWDAWQKMGINEDGSTLGSPDNIDIDNLYEYYTDSAEIAEDVLMNDMQERLSYMRRKADKAELERFRSVNSLTSFGENINTNSLKGNNSTPEVNAKKSKQNQNDLKKQNINTNPLKPMTDNIINTARAAGESAIARGSAAANRILHGDGIDNIYYKRDRGLIGDVASGVRSVDRTIQSQVKSLERKLVGNIGNIVEDSINVVGNNTRAVVKNTNAQINSDVNSKIRNTGNIVGKEIDKTSDKVQETIADELGNIYSNINQPVSGNQIGKNRLNANLGKI